ncbi:amidase-like [Mytilus californianus]|uniref:amidase-like n=1 Tax=Mytilus californianus TaxID=6549 RepID=UPI002246E448|nr:amidase-like [Mytilus californianus]
MASGTQDLYKSPVCQKPHLDELKQIDADLRLKLSDEDLKEMHENFQGLIGSLQRLNEIPEPQLPVKYPRTPGYKAEDDAWYWKCDIKGAAKGKLAGKTIGIKDNVAVAGVPMMNGSKILEGYTPEFDATIITRILDEGGNIVGKTVCEDMCYSVLSCTASTGPVKNPIDSKLSAGGSSSGSAALLGRKEIDLAIGGDQGGSIRIPSSCCGIVGLKPTFGLVPYTGIASLELTLDHVGPMARTVTDCALLLEVIAGYDEGRDPRQIPNMSIPKYSQLIDAGIEGFKIGIVKEGFESQLMEADVAEIVKGAANKFRGAGATVEDTSIPLHNDGIKIWHPIALQGQYNCMIKGNGTGYNWKGHYPTSMQEAFARNLFTRPYDMPHSLKKSCVMAEYIQRNYQNKFYAKAMNRVQSLTKAYDDALKEYDVLIMSTVPIKPIALPTGNDDLKEKRSKAACAMKNNAPFNATGHPALSINAGFSEGLPVGMMIIGKKYDETTILKVARAYEKIRDN